MRCVSVLSAAVMLFLSAGIANAYVVQISETEKLVCPDTIGGYTPGGTYTTGAGGKFDNVKVEKNADVTITMAQNGCIRTKITGYQGPEQCGTTRMELETGQIFSRSSCDTAQFQPGGTASPNTNGPKSGNETNYTGALVDISELEKILATWPASAKANCSAVLGCRSGNPMNVGTFHGKVRNYKFDEDGYPVDGVAAGINLIRQWCQNEGLCSIRTIMLKYAPFDVKHPGNNPVKAAEAIGSFIGMNADARFNHHDATTMGKIALGFVRNENGKYHYGAESIKRGAELAFQMWPAGATPKNLGEMIPYTVTTGSTQGDVGNSAVNNFNSAIRSFSPVTNSTPAQPVSGITSNANTSSSAVNSVAVATSSIKSGGTALNILVQPSSIQRGGTLIVSWTSVNAMKDTCQVQFQDQQFAQGPEGTKQFKTVSSDNGALTFTLKCQDKSGQLYTASGSASIQ